MTSEKHTPNPVEEAMTLAIDKINELRFALTEEQKRSAALLEALKDTTAALETSEACLKTWNDGQGGPLAVDKIVARSRALIAQAEESQP